MVSLLRIPLDNSLYAGGKCGSTAIDRNFYRLMAERFGNAFTSLSHRKTGPGSIFMNKFELIKRDFGYSDDEQTYELPLDIALTKADPEYFDVDERLVLISK